MADSKNAKTKKTTARGRILAVLIIIIAACGAGGFLLNRSSGERKEDIRRLSEERYDAFFTSMYDIDNYDPEDFAHYRGLETLILSDRPSDLRALSDYFGAAFSSPNPIDTVYLGLDPAVLWDSCMHRKKLWNRQLEYLTSCMDSHPDVTFEILLPYPALSYWTAMSKAQLSETLTLYQALGDAVSPRANSRVHFIGAEEWLIANPGNYAEDFSVVNPQLTHRLLLLNFCDKVYLMKEDMLSRKLSDLRALAETEMKTPPVYPDLSDWYLVFLGDSVMTYDTGSSSIPGAVCGLSGADAANLSQGGCPATADPAAVLSLERMIDALETPAPEKYTEAADFCTGLTKYKTDAEQGITNARKLCFIICLGLNDYFGAHPVDDPSAPYDIGSYGGALRSGCSRLRGLYPECRILIMAPSYCDAFSGGTEQAGPSGGVLADYVDAAIAVSREAGADCANVYADSGINAETHSLYLADGVHPNESGRFLLGKYLVNILGEISHEE